MTKKLKFRIGINYHATNYKQLKVTYITDANTCGMIMTLFQTSSYVERASGIPFLQYQTGYANYYSPEKNAELKSITFSKQNNND